MDSETFCKLVILLHREIEEDDDDHKRMMAMARARDLIPSDLASENFQDICNVLERIGVLCSENLDCLMDVSLENENNKVYKNMCVVCRMITDNYANTSEVGMENKGEQVTVVKGNEVKPVIPELRELYSTIVTRFNAGLQRVREIHDVPRELDFKLFETLLDAHERAMALYERKKKEGIKFCSKECSWLMTFTLIKQESLRQLWELYKSGELLTILQNGLISKYLLTKCAVELMELSVHISQEDYRTAIEAIGIRVSLVRGNIQNEKVDVIVCAVDNSLNMAASGAAARALLATGGKTLQRECRERFPCGIKFGNVITIKGGKLKCRRVYLSSLPDYKIEERRNNRKTTKHPDLSDVNAVKKENYEDTNKNPDLNNEKTERDDDNATALRYIICEVLKKATKEHVKSIALPAIGTGKMKLAPDKVATIMYDCVKCLPRESLSEVRIVVQDKATFQAFRKEHFMIREFVSAGVRRNERRIVLIGKTGSGKSATGNTILGIRDAFASTYSCDSITKFCQRKTAERFGKNLMVVDTPGLFDTGMSKKHTKNEIGKCIGITAPGPHAIILVTQIGRFTEEELKIVNLFTEQFGKEMYRHLIVLSTRKDDLKTKNISVGEYAKYIESLTGIIKKCQDRYIAFDNFSPDKDKDVQSLLDMIENIVQKNGETCYINDMFIEAEIATRQRMTEIREEQRKEKEKKRKYYRDEVAKLYVDKIKAQENEAAKIKLYLNKLKIMEQNEREMQQQLEEKNKHLQKEREDRKKKSLIETQRQQAEIQRLKQKEIDHENLFERQRQMKKEKQHKKSRFEAQNQQAEQRLKHDHQKMFDKQHQLEKEKQLQKDKEERDRKSCIKDQNQQAEIQRLRQKEIDHEKLFDKQQQLEKEKQLQKDKEERDKKSCIKAQNQQAEIQRLRQKEIDHEKLFDKQQQLEKEKQMQKDKEERDKKSCIKAQNQQAEIQRLRQKEIDHEKLFDRQQQLEKEKQLQKDKDEKDNKSRIKDQNQQADLQRLKQKRLNHEKLFDRQQQLEKEKQLQKDKEERDRKSCIKAQNQQAEIQRLRQKEIDHQKLLDRQQQLEKDKKQQLQKNMDEKKKIQEYEQYLKKATENVKQLKIEMKKEQDLKAAAIEEEYKNKIRDEQLRNKVRNEVEEEGFWNMVWF